MQVLSNALVRIVGRRIRQLQALITSVGKPVAAILTRQPVPPAYVQQLPKIRPIDRDEYVNAGKHAEAQHQAQELIELLVLQGIVEKVVPLVDLDVEIDQPKHQADDEREQPARLPA